MTVRYGVVKEIYSLNGDTRVSYGIAVYANSDKDGTMCIIDSVCDITTDLESLRELTEKCNCLELSPIHLNNVVEDFLNSYTNLNR